MTDRWRCFVAVPIAEGLRAELAAAVGSWRGRSDLDGLRWSDPAGWHVTLAFLGSVDASSVPEIARRLEDALRGHEPAQHATGGLGGFPSAGRARVAWYGVADAGGRLRSLAAVVRGALSADDPAPFRAHVTLARARSGMVDLRPWIATADAPTGRVEVGEVRLMRSHLGRGPARYETLASVPLRVPARV